MESYYAVKILREPRRKGQRERERMKERLISTNQNEFREKDRKATEHLSLPSSST